ncbi:MAG TPA: GDP-mannose dehydrogenase, partial [Syntrophales bacterium]|nr:GDP-mannose dehydrogenase [Syntrophales bacterium]
MKDQLVSVSPNGESFTLPQQRDYELEFERLQNLVNERKSMGHEIVVVMGLGFVGAVMAGVVADTVDRS